MVVGVFEIGLQQVVIHVLGRKLGLDPAKPHSFELQHHHGSSGVLSESLVNFKTDFLTRLHSALNQMTLDQFLRYIFSHGFTSITQISRSVRRTCLVFP